MTSRRTLLTGMAPSGMALADMALAGMGVGPGHATAANPDDEPVRLSALLVQITVETKHPDESPASCAHGHPAAYHAYEKAASEMDDEWWETAERVSLIHARTPEGRRAKATAPRLSRERNVSSLFKREALTGL